VSVFYERFERHEHGRGLKARSTHYCAGCGHGLVQRYLSDAIEEHGVQDRTVAVSPVGCAVFLYYYLDVGNTQAAHGRASAVALGHKLANPEAVVVSYQGDGDLAAIGLLEIMHVAQLGVPLAVIFVNNAVYGMTGGQLAPTTLLGQRTTTTPTGRDRSVGGPLRVAELMASLDGTAYVERVALFDSKQRRRAKKAISKAIRLQSRNEGFAFVEVLAECPTHLHATPAEAERWVREQMLPVFPLGVKKDAPSDFWRDAFRTRAFDPLEVLAAVGADAEDAPRSCEAFPRTAFGDDVGVKIAGAGGDGAQTAALLLARAAVNEGFDATHIPSYGPESRGGTSYADVHVAADEVLSPASPHPHVLIAFNAPSLDKFAGTVRDGGTIIYDSSVIDVPPPMPPGVTAYGVPMTRIAADLGKPVVKNIVALGALQGATGIFPVDTFLTAIRQALMDKCAMIPLNEQAFEWGRTSVAPRTV
jgi:2-oxoisovalerate ferredoxin oxidoreductase beta subunit